MKFWGWSLCPSLALCSAGSSPWHLKDHERRCSFCSSHLGDGEVRSEPQGRAVPFQRQSLWFLATRKGLPLKKASASRCRKLYSLLQYPRECSENRLAARQQKSNVLPIETYPRSKTKAGSLNTKGRMPGGTSERREEERARGDLV